MNFRFLFSRSTPNALAASTKIATSASSAALVWLMALFAWAAFAFFQAPAVLAAATTATTAPNNEVAEQRFAHLAQELRCLVCQNESLASSHADLAADLRHEVLSLIAQGHDDDAIKKFLVQRYGDFVLYRPPVKPLTWFLWFGPFILLLLALLMLIVIVRQRRSQALKTPPPSKSERDRALALLNQKETPTL